MIKGIVYYTDNRCEERIMYIVRKQLEKAGLPIVSVSHFPIDFGKNIVVDMPRCEESRERQILIGLEALSADYAFLCEHDVLYHESHFDIVPYDAFFFNQNRWCVCAKTGQALFYYTMALSHCSAPRQMLIDHYTMRVEKIEKHGYNRKMGHSPKGFRKCYMSKHPNVDIRHNSNFTKNRFKLSQFRKKPEGFNLTDEIPHWGKTKGQFDEFVRRHYG